MSAAPTARDSVSRSLAVANGVPSTVGRVSVAESRAIRSARTVRDPAKALSVEVMSTRHVDPASITHVAAGSATVTWVA